MATNNDIYRNYCENSYRDLKSDKEANSMRIVDKEDFTIVEGYEHAMYSLKVGNNIVIFKGWYGYSSTTSTHLNQLQREAEQTIGINVHTSQEKPKSHQSDLQKIFDKEELEEAIPQSKLNQLTAEAL